MNILQLTSDWKWTGPAEPMVRLARGLKEAGHRVWVAAPEPPEPVKRSLAEETARAGFPLSLTIDYAHGTRPLRDRRDIGRLREFVARRDIELVQTWHTRDHMLAWRALGLRATRRRAALVRWYKTAEAISHRLHNRVLYGAGCDGLLCVSPKIAERNRGLCHGPVAGVFGAVDTEVFAPAPKNPQVLSSLGLSPEHRVVGIVARGQRKRRFPLLLEAAKRLFERDPDARLLIIGRGTHRREVAEEPARELGIADRVVFAGYRVDDYLDVVRCIDVFTFLVPGSDGTCRALLEALSLGMPAVTTRRGALPEIVRHGVTGYAVGEDPDALAGHWQELLADPARRARFGEAARDDALRRFGIPRFAEEVGAFYGRVLASRRS